MHQTSNCEPNLTTTSVVGKNTARQTKIRASTPEESQMKDVLRDRKRRRVCAADQSTHKNTGTNRVTTPVA
jgi:hypothetical protein